MSTVHINKNKIDNIAKAIRDKKSSEETYTLSEMAEEIETIAYIPEEISQQTCEEETVLLGKKFYDTNGILTTGEMPIPLDKTPPVFIQTNALIYDYRLDGYYNVAYGNGIFVAINVSWHHDNDHYYKYSYDGLTWHEEVLPTCTGYENTNKWNNIIFVDGYFYIIGCYYNDILKSNDGINWTVINAFNFYPWFDTVGYGKGILFGTGGEDYDGDPMERVMYTTDFGNTWNQSNVTPVSEWVGSAYGNGKYVIVGGLIDGYTHNYNCMISDDCINWTGIELFNGENLTDICFGNDQFIAVGHNKIARSNDGSNWTEVSVPQDFPTNISKDITFFEGIYIISCSNATGSIQATYYSFDGQTWVKVPSVGSTGRMAYGNGTLVGSRLFALNNSEVRLSSWSKLSGFPTVNLYRNNIVYADNKYTLISGTSSPYSCKYSTNLVSWSTGSTNLTQYSNLVYYNGIYLVGNYGSAYWYSNNGTTWVSKTPPKTSWDGYYLADTKFGFLMLADDGATSGGYYSTNGINWTSFSLGRSEYNKHVNCDSVCLLDLDMDEDYYEEGRVVCIKNNYTYEIKTYLHGIFEPYLISDEKSICVAAKSNYIQYIICDGINIGNWTDATINDYDETVTFSRGFYADGLFVFTTSDNNICYISGDGKIWNRIEKDLNIFSGRCAGPDGTLVSTDGYVLYTK